MVLTKKEIRKNEEFVYNTRYFLKSIFVWLSIGFISIMAIITLLVCLMNFVVFLASNDNDLYLLNLFSCIVIFYLLCMLIYYEKKMKCGDI